MTLYIPLIQTLSTRVIRSLGMDETISEQRANTDKKRLIRFFALAVPLVSAITITTLQFQAVNAQLSQLSPAQQQALKSLVATGYTNSYPINPPRTWCTGCPKISIPYSINLGQLLAIVPDQPRTALDIILAPTQHQTTHGLFTIQIPRWALDSKNPSGADIPFRVTMDGHGLAWKQLQETNTYRVVGLYFSGDNTLLQIFGTKGAVTKAFPTNH